MAETEKQAGASPEDDGPPLPASYTFMVPKKEISMVPDMGKWKRSQAYADYIGFILTLNEGVKGKKLTCDYPVSEVQPQSFITHLSHCARRKILTSSFVAPLFNVIVKFFLSFSLCAFQTIEKLLSLLGTLDRWIDETPPVDQPSRFGNKAYRTWYGKLEQEAEALVAAVLPDKLSAAVPEVAVYLKEAVGNSTRIDYGTGHEAAFAAFLCCLCKIGALRVEDQLAIIFKVFDRYLHVMRKLQKTYRMEPAGSQGVWGLDDFQFLPFIWGSSQLIDHPTLEPRHFVEEKVVNEHHQDYMFLECIKFINEMKTGPFAEHSNQLWNISAVPSWAKVNQGLIRMYKAECLEKFPVIQHFKFGSLLSIQPVKP
ncbi:serine/threonine-protein phosphatase 2A activator isoform X1 [Pangasianodon hypophthalmus]|uniref:serine/threonine-protein phosphatase 2A activator isoform X1 n=1 Tax=Pangasianodon hypophthalmus TaxID=310915 RepID=UPI002306E1A0|nr:serine/threonine-protein phosphatase 2A activator isoform X1 [Pangasianodon hypophthalmus]